jgi:vancomycin aglycone glucosyltransferase
VRVLLSTYGSRGDVEPMVALAVRVRALGAEAAVCAPPDEEFTGLLARAGVPLVPFGRAWRSWQPPSTPAEQAGRVTELIAAQYDTLAVAARECDVLVAAGLSHLAARSAAEKAAIPYQYVLFCPSMLDASPMYAAVGPPVSAHRASIGLPPAGDVREFLFTGHPWLAADPVLAPLPEPAGLRVAPAGAWILPDERPLPASLAAFLDAGTPPVYAGFGSMPMRASADIARVVIEAIRAQGRRVLIARGRADLALIDDRDDCLAIGEVNQQALFRRVAAVMHHGGAGTTTTAALAGVPQAVVPQVVDQPYWAGRVAALGIGAAHDGPAPTVESLSAVLRTALAPQARARAAAVASAIRTDGATVAARLLTGAGSPGQDTEDRRRRPTQDTRS